MLRIDRSDHDSISHRLDAEGLLYQPINHYCFYNDVALRSQWKCSRRYSGRILEEFSRHHPYSVSASVAAVYQDYLDKTGLDAALSYSRSLDELNQLALGDTVNGALLRGLDETEKLAMGAVPYSASSLAREEARKHSLMLNPHSSASDLFGHDGTLANINARMSADELYKASLVAPPSFSRTMAADAYKELNLPPPSASMLGEVPLETVSTIMGNDEQGGHKGPLRYGSLLDVSELQIPPLPPPPLPDFKEEKQRREQADNKWLKLLSEAASQPSRSQKPSIGSRVNSVLNTLIGVALLLIGIFSNWTLEDLTSFLSNLFG